MVPDGALEGAHPDALALVSRFDSTDLGRQIAAGDQVEREFDFVMVLEDMVLRGQIDLALDGGKRWVGIWELVGDTLKLNYVDAAGQYPRPTTFMTAENADGALVTFQRVPRR